MSLLYVVNKQTKICALYAGAADMSLSCADKLVICDLNVVAAMMMTMTSSALLHLPCVHAPMQQSSIPTLFMSADPVSRNICEPHTKEPQNKTSPPSIQVTSWRPLTYPAETLRQSSSQLFHLAQLLRGLRFNHVTHLDCKLLVPKTQQENGHQSQIQSSSCDSSHLGSSASKEQQRLQVLHWVCAQRIWLIFGSLLLFAIQKNTKI